MKTLLLPACILLLTASCSKVDMPRPVTAEVGTHTPLSNARISNDTLVRITVPPLGRGPVAVETGPVIR